MFIIKLLGPGYISLGQAILLVLQENDIPEEVKLRLEKIYVTGCENENDVDFVTEIISNASKSNFYLQSVNISFDAKTIDADPSRRYFETHLAYHTTLAEIKKLDLDKVKQHYTHILALIGKYDPILGESLKNVVNRELTEPWNDLSLIKDKLGADVAEYFSAMIEAEKKFSQEDYEKMKYVVSATLLGVICTRLYTNKAKENAELFNELPINIYGKGPYSPSYRGRQTRDGLHFFSTTGILKSHTPAPYYNDPARYAEIDKQHCFTFKPTENSQYVLGVQEKNWSDHNFAKLLHPFVNSISGTMLSQLRASNQLLSDGNFQFNEIGQFSNYIKCLVSSMLYLSGGHSFYEFTYPLNVKEIQDAYKEIPGFKEQMTLENLFYQTNSGAFSKALDSAGKYNVQMIQRALMHEELVNTVSSRTLSI